ncbi:MAG: hypothetical protein WAW86_06755 [Gammaproteobacteria bacterium]
MFTHPPVTYDVNMLCEHYLHILYRDVKVNHQQMTINETYGEILYSGLCKIITSLMPSRDDILYDLGSGLGKAALQIFFTTTMKRVHGIELIPTLHQEAVVALEKSKLDIPLFFSERTMSFECGDFLKASIADASIVLVGSPCFSPSLLRELAHKLDSNLKTHTVLSLKTLPLNTFMFRKVIRVECSWDTALCYVYERK